MFVNGYETPTKYSGSLDFDWDSRWKLDRGLAPGQHYAGQSIEGETIYGAAD